MRGNPSGDKGRQLVLGSIPACAGEPRRQRLPQYLFTVYPRVCGGTTVEGCKSDSESGLSPRVRGNPPKYKDGFKVTRSIPACAGEPPQSSTRCLPSPVYPRVCGGTAYTV